MFQLLLLEGNRQMQGMIHHICWPIYQNSIFPSLPFPKHLIQAAGLCLKAPSRLRKNKLEYNFPVPSALCERLWCSCVQRKGKFRLSLLVSTCALILKFNLYMDGQEREMKFQKLPKLKHCLIFKFLFELIFTHWMALDEWNWQMKMLIPLPPTKKKKK